MSSLTYRPELDGLRSIAVYLVLGFHAHLALLDGGFVGVDLFFVLSGFLVTGVLLRDVRTQGRVRLGRFYARRVRRLLPAALVVICATSLLQLLLLSLPARLDLVDDARASTLYFANWHFIAESRDYFAQNEAASPFLHFWSLSIEEQFYIVFPVVVLAVARWSRRPVRTLAVVLLAIGTTSVAAQVLTASSDPTLAFYATHTRVYQLAAGGLLMTLLLARDGQARRTTSARGWSLTAVAGLIGVLVVASGLVDLSASVRGLLATAGSVLLIGGLWNAPRGPLARVLALPLPRYLGQVSYGTYLWHWPVTLAVQQLFDSPPVVDALLTALVATGLAALSYQVLEVPIRAARPLNRVPWPVVLGGLTTSVLLVATALPGILESPARPAVASGQAPGAPPTGAGGADLRAPVPADLDLVGASDDYGNDTETPCTVDSPDACVVVDGPDGAPHVLLLGDSQANTMIPAFEAMAQEQGLRLSTNVRSGCPWQADQVNVSRGNTEGQDKCRALRDAFYADVLPLMDVDLVVVAGLSRSDETWEDGLTSSSSPPGETLAGLQARTTRATAALVTDAGARLAIVHSVFGPGGYDLTGFDPIECLAAAETLGDCAIVPPPRRPVVDEVYDALDAESPDVETLDLTPVVCPDYPTCSPVVDDTVVWMDVDHVTATYWRTQHDEVWERLSGTGFLP